MSSLTGHAVGVGSRIMVRDLRDHDVFTISITTSLEIGDTDQVLPSSPIALALMGTRVDDCVTWRTPRGYATFRILSIDREGQS